MTTLNTQKVTGQKSLFPEILELSAGDFMLVGEILADLEYLGFELNVFGKNGYAIHATPPDLSYTRAKEVLIELIEHYKNTEGNPGEDERTGGTGFGKGLGNQLQYGTQL